MNQTIPILVLDDNLQLHNNFKTLLEALNVRANRNKENYKVDYTVSRTEALDLVQQSVEHTTHYALIFIAITDRSVPYALDFIKNLWSFDNKTQVLIYGQFTEARYKKIYQALDYSDKCLIFKKPFILTEIIQVLMILIEKWKLTTQVQALAMERLHELDYLYSLANATLDATQEAILAVGLDEKILTYNQNFIQLWDIKEDALKTETASLIFQKIAGKMDDAVVFLATFSGIGLHSQAHTSREWRLANGTVIEIFTHPQYLHQQRIGTVYSFRDISSQKNLEKQLTYQATHDVLTGLPNRSLLYDRLNQAILQAKRTNTLIAILLIDLDFFKEINDTLGHKSGDLLLKFYAQRIKEFLRQGDTASRLGGDEFVVILPDLMEEKSLLDLLNRLLDLFALPFQLENAEISTTASIGISICPQDGETVDVLLKNADTALYQAKERGRHCFQFYREEFNKHILERIALNNALKKAIKNDEFILNYQPLIDLNNNCMIGIEALIRWNHPTLGILLPSSFIPAAEESGLIHAIGEWVLRTACNQGKIWHKSKKIKVSVNISVKQFRQKEFVPLVQMILEETKFDPNYLEFEITERLLLGNITEVLQKMRELKNLGIHFVIDDFGTGYSSFSYLKHFPFDRLKIDRSYIESMATDAYAGAIVQAIIAMTKNLGITVLAEGVEEITQVEYLRAHHGEQVQGYYFSEPLSPQDCTLFLMQIREK